MRVLKLNTTTSTNDFLKEMAAGQKLENFTVVTALEQTNGKGQMGAKWLSKKGKNLMTSIFVTDVIDNPNQIFDLNIAFAQSVISALGRFEIPSLSIKWPNDIMSGDKKIGGILIENVFKGSGGIMSIVGLGLNVNQTDFSDLPKASSLQVICEREFDIDLLLQAIVATFEMACSDLSKMRDALWVDYESNLFKNGVPMPFEDSAGNRFMGIIQGVDSSGKLKLLRENDAMELYAIKEIRMLY